MAGDPSNSSNWLEILKNLSPGPSLAAALAAWVGVYKWRKEKADARDERERVADQKRRDALDEQGRAILQDYERRAREAESREAAYVARDERRLVEIERLRAESSENRVLAVSWYEDYRSVRHSHDNVQQMLVMMSKKHRDIMISPHYLEALPPRLTLDRKGIAS